MNIVESRNLGREPTTLGKEVGALDLYDGLSTPFSEDVIQLVPEHVEQIEAYALTSAALYGPADGNKEPTYVQNTLDMPSLVVRIDCTVIDGNIVTYEMEDSPSGQGITDRIHRSVGAVGIKDLILNHYQIQVGDIPRVIISGARGHGTDDAMIVGPDKYVFDTDGILTLSKDELVIVKTIPGVKDSQSAYISLQSRAVAPLATEGNKTYLERRGDLRPVATADELLVDDDGNLISQVMKARLGSMAMGVSMYLTSADKELFTRAGTVTASRLRRQVEDYNQTLDGALVQPFNAPILIENNEGRKNAIMRVFVLLGKNNNTPTARVIGGCYVARPGMIVHGAGDAVSGAVVVQEDYVSC